MFIQAWDFRPGQNFVLEMQNAASKADKTIAVLSQSYLEAEFTQPEWAAAFATDPKGEHRKLIPIRVAPCKLEGLQASIIYIDLVGLSEEPARQKVINGLSPRAKPNEPPRFPGAGDKADRPAMEREFLSPVEFPGSLKTHWNVPEGVPYFTGRTDVLEKLRKALIEDTTTALSQRLAIYGLGGIGKTQTAIAYAKKYRVNYKAVLWAVAESRDSIMSDFVALAGVLKLPEKNIADQSLVVSAVRRWLEENRDWLLILDNADEPTLLVDFLPSSSNGHILLTSRAPVFQIIGILNPIEMEEMSPEDAKKFLLTRTGRSDLQPDEEKALEQIALELDYLPLALEQAGAYITELGARFQDYLLSYRARGLELLEKGVLTSQSRKSVRTTWSLNFQEVEKSSKASADLLRASAFFSPDRIPYELIALGSVDLGAELSSALGQVDSNPIAFDELVNPLVRYSLIHRDLKSKTYDIHRLVQAVFKEGMDADTKRIWAEHAVNAVASVLPEIDINDSSGWAQIERILPHAQIGSELIEEWNIESLEAARLLNHLGRYMHFRARLNEAESLYTKSLEIREPILGSNHPDVASSLFNQGWLRLDQGRYTEAEPLLLQSLTIRKQALDSDHLDISTSFSHLGHLYIRMGRYFDAEDVFNQALRIREKKSDQADPDTVAIWIAQARIYFDLYKFDKAESLLLRSLHTTENALGYEHYLVADSLSLLSAIYQHWGRFRDAEELLLRSIKIAEDAFGSNYPAVATYLNYLGDLYVKTGKLNEGEPLIDRAFAIREKILGQEHPDLAFSFDSIARLRKSQGRYTEAEAFFNRSLNHREKMLGKDHILVADSLIDLASFFYSRHETYKSEPLIRRAVAIRRKILGPTHPQVVNAMLDHAQILKNLNRKGEAQKIEAQAKRILSKRDKKSRVKE